MPGPRTSAEAYRRGFEAAALERQRAQQRRREELLAYLRAIDAMMREEAARKAPARAAPPRTPREAAAQATRTRARSLTLRSPDRMSVTLRQRGTQRLAQSSGGGWKPPTVRQWTVADRRKQAAEELRRQYGGKQVASLYGKGNMGVAPGYPPGTVPEPYLSFNGKPPKRPGDHRLNPLTGEAEIAILVPEAAKIEGVPPLAWANVAMYMGAAKAGNVIEPVYLDQHIRVTKPGEDWDPKVTGIPRGSISVRDFLARFTNMSDEQKLWWKHQWLESGSYPKEYYNVLSSDEVPEINERTFTGDDTMAMVQFVASMIEESGILAQSAKRNKKGELVSPPVYSVSGMSMTEVLEDLKIGMVPFLEAQYEALGGGGGGGYGGGGGGGGGGAAGITVSIESEEGLRQAADLIAQEMLGRRLAPNEEDEVVRAVHEAEVSAGNQELAASEANLPGVTTVEKVDVEAIIRKRIRELLGGQTGAYDVLNVFNTFASMLGPGGLVGQVGAGSQPAVVGPSTTAAPGGLV